MPDEIPSPAPETPEVQNPEVAPEVLAPPPATKLVVHGLKSEREVELEALLATAERGKRAAEFLAAEKELEAQALKARPFAPPRPPKPAKHHNWLSPVIGADDE